MKMSVGRSDPPPKDKKWGEGEEGGKGKEVQKIKSYSDVMKMKLDKYELFFFRFLLRDLLKILISWVIKVVIRG